MLNLKAENLKIKPQNMVKRLQKKEKNSKIKLWRDKEILRKKLLDRKAHGKKQLRIVKGDLKQRPMLLNKQPSHILKKQKKRENNLKKKHNRI